MRGKYFLFSEITKTIVMTTTTMMMIITLKCLFYIEKIFFLTAGLGNAARGKTTRHIGLYKYIILRY